MKSVWRVKERGFGIEGRGERKAEEMKLNDTKEKERQKRVGDENNEWGVGMKYFDLGRAVNA